MKSFVMFLPNMVIMLARLIRDPRVPTAEKALLVAALVYVISPIDLIPDFFPFIGQVDDVFVVALTVLRLINRTDENVVRAAWPGGGDIFALAESIANLAPKFLPRRIARVITARIELAPPGTILLGVTKGGEAIVREVGLDAEHPIETRSAVAS